MFKKLFGSKTAPEPEAGPQLGMLMLRSGKGLNAAAIIKAWSDLFPKVSVLTSGGSSQDKKNSVAEFQTEGRALMLAAMPAPIPQAEVDEAAERSWMWPEAAAEVKQQKAHAIVLTTSTDNPVQSALDVTRLLAAAASVTDSVGIYWGNGGHVHSPAFFIDMAQSMTEDGMLPCMLWIGVVMSGRSEKGPFSLTTHGMNSFGHKDLEIIDTRMTPGDLRGMIYDTINYLLNAGPVFKHGQTFGPTPTAKWKIEHTTSKFSDGDPVIRLHIP